MKPMNFVIINVNMSIGNCLSIYKTNSIETRP